MKVIRPITINDAALVSSNVTENDYAAYNAGTTYNLGDRAIYVTTDTHWIIESLQNSNAGHTPTGLDTDTWWLLVGYTNRWKMFDQSVQSQTSNANTIEVEVVGNGRVDSVALLNVDASSVTVTMTDATDGEVFNQTYSMVSDSGITDWYAYFFEPIVRKTDLVVTGMPPYVGATIGVIIDDTGDTALCGAMIVGQSRFLGDTQYGLGLGISDYSVKQQDDFGNYTILERAYRRRAEATILVENSLVDQVMVLLAQFRATPTVYVADDELRSSVIYGFYKDFIVNIDYLEYSICTLELEGLT